MESRPNHLWRSEVAGKPGTMRTEQAGLAQCQGRTKGASKARQETQIGTGKSHRLPTLAKPIDFVRFILGGSKQSQGTGFDLASDVGDDHSFLPTIPWPDMGWCRRGEHKDPAYCCPKKAEKARPACQRQQLLTKAKAEEGQMSGGARGRRDERKPSFRVQWEQRRSHEQHFAPPPPFTNLCPKVASAIQ